MPPKNNAKKTEFLGMNFSTASGRLRKLVLFDLLERHRENICFRCNKKIKEVKQLSIEHIKPWLDKDVALFWDLDNVSFSHVNCNSAAAVKVNKIVCPEGLSWCQDCVSFLPVEQFYKTKKYGRWNGLGFICKKCDIKASIERRKNRRLRNNCGP